MCARTASAVLRHTVGRERWGQRRLRFALGDAPFERDTYHGSAPDPAATLNELASALRATLSAIMRPGPGRPPR